jgi:hypothetical protein
VLKLPAEAYLPGQAFYRPFPIEYYCARESSMAQKSHIESECSEILQCAVQMPESNYEMRNKR